VLLSPMLLRRQCVAAAALFAVVSPQGLGPLEQQQQPYSVRFHLQLEADGAIEDAAFALTVHPAWAPLGAARFAELVDAEFFNGARFFRVVPDFVVQWGLPASPGTAALWDNRTIQDDPVTESNLRGFVSYAASGPNTRTTQLFINTRVAGNARLDDMGFAPFGVIDAAGMAVVDRIFAGHAEEPDQGRISEEGNAYLARDFPFLSWIRSVERCGATAAGPTATAGMQSAQQCTVEGRVRHSGVLRVGSPFDFPPFSAWDGSAVRGI
jgi:peptidyl-prolyl cis-trans isomerase A (cyclophilin A)